jgi:hypothetical protein
MSVFKVGKATLTRIEETYLAVYPPKDIFPELTDALFKEHGHWLAPNHYDPETNKIKLSVHSWLLQLDGHKILIDGCCGNQKIAAAAPILEHAQHAVAGKACRRRCTARRD